MARCKAAPKLSRLPVKEADQSFSAKVARSYNSTINIITVIFTAFAIISFISEINFTCSLNTAIAKSFKFIKNAELLSNGSKESMKKIKALSQQFSDEAKEKKLDERIKKNLDFINQLYSDKGWEDVADTKLQFNLFMLPKSMEAFYARDFCFGMGGSLPVHNNSNQLQYIINHYRREKVWLGIIRSKYGWKSMNGGTVNIEKKFWDMNKPEEGEDCVYANGLQLYSGRCDSGSDVSHVLCQRIKT